MKLHEAVRLAKTVKVEHAQRFAQHVVPQVVRPARVIWNQAIGAIFLLLAVSFGVYAGTHRSNPAGLGFSLFLCAVMLYFGISSFVRARSIGLSGTRRA